MSHLCSSCGAKLMMSDSVCETVIQYDERGRCVEHDWNGGKCNNEPPEAHFEMSQKVPNAPKKQRQCSFQDSKGHRSCRNSALAGGSKCRDHECPKCNGWKHHAKDMCRKCTARATTENVEMH